jgi:predicted RNA-binding Zn ribbon-like protein
MAGLNYESGGDRDGFIFRSDRLCLDFVGTLKGRRREIQNDLLERASDLTRWLSSSGLAGGQLSVSEADLRAARSLREAIYRLVRGRLDGADYLPADLDTVNRWAKATTPAPQLGPGGVTYLGLSPASCFSVLARDCIDLLGGPLSDRVRNCSGESCGVIFLDTSRQGQRRWCSMAACGNTAKVQAFRRREGGKK